MIVCRREMLAVERSPPLDRSETLRRSPGTGESVGRLSKVSSFFIESFTLKFLLPLEISFFLPPLLPLPGRKRSVLNHVVHRIAIFRGISSNFSGMLRVKVHLNGERKNKECHRDRFIEETKV